jgi:hypothetical protein
VFLLAIIGIGLLFFFLKKENRQNGIKHNQK